MSKKIKLFDPVINIAEEKAVIKVLRSRFWASGSGIGNVEKFEKKFNKYVGSNSTVAVAELSREAMHFQKFRGQFHFGDVGSLKILDLSDISLYLS